MLKMCKNGQNWIFGSEKQALFTQCLKNAYFLLVKYIMDIENNGKWIYETPSESIRMTLKLVIFAPNVLKRPKLKVWGWKQPLITQCPENALFLVVKHVIDIEKYG